MRQGNEQFRKPQIPGDVSRDAREDKARRPARRDHDLHIRPGDAAPPTSADGFERCFFGRESRRKMLIAPLAAFGVSALAGREAPLEESIPVLLDHLRNAGDLDKINSMGAHGSHECNRTARRQASLRSMCSCDGVFTSDASPRSAMPRMSR